MAIFDADVLKRPSIRALRPGDRIAPFGMEGRRKVRDLLREAGVPAPIRERFLVVLDQNGQVVWVPGVMCSRLAPVGPLTSAVWVFWIVGAAQLQGDSRSVTLGPEDFVTTARADDSRRRPRLRTQDDE
jgi:tRNA(Ile)-lysidine synthetase-like protein